MCGIAGFSGRFEADVLTRMSSAICHRGPDDVGQWYRSQSKVGLAHRRLSIIDVSALGHQPMIDEQSRSVMVYNGEIYNYRELRGRLESDGHRFKSQSDTEVLMTLFRVHGDAMLPMLNGIFAFAIYDSGDDTLFVACDSMAIKPLYYAEGCNGFLFASELKGLMACGEIDRTLDVPSLFRTLGFLFSPGGATPFKSVRRFGPGEALRAKNGRIQRRWTWAESKWNSASLRVDAPEAIARVTGAVRTAVHRQMVADVPIGAFLSGGLDSGAVVAMAREVSPQIDCFTIDTGSNRDAGVTDDLPYARQVAKHLQLRLHEIQVDSARMAADLERMVFQLDEPLADPAPLNVMYISQLARQAGVKVLLSGAGGDDLFTGYRRHRAVMAEPYWTWLPKPVRSGLRAGSARFGSQSAFGRRLAKAFAHADWPARQRLAGYFLWADPKRVLGLFAPEHRATLAAERMTGPLEDYLDSLPRSLPPLQQMLSLEQRFYLPDHNLLYTDKMSMSTGVEVRVPFLDNDLMALANSLPTKFKQHGREGKWVLKKAMEPYLPSHVIYRPKTGFGAPLRHWLRHELRDLVDDLLSADTLRRRGLFDPQAVTRLVADDRGGRIDAAYTILGLLCIEIWCRKFAQ